MTNKERWLEMYINGQWRIMELILEQQEAIALDLVNKELIIRYQ